MLIISIFRIKPGKMASCFIGLSQFFIKYDPFPLYPFIRIRGYHGLVFKANGHNYRFLPVLLLANISLQVTPGVYFITLFATVFRP